MARTLELALFGMYSYLAAQLPAAIAAENALVPDGITLIAPECSFNTLPDYSHPATLAFYPTDYTYGGPQPGTPPVAIDFVIQIRFQGKATASSLDTTNLLALRYMDALNSLFNSDCTLGNSADTAGITHVKNTVDMTNHSGYVDFYCRAEVQLY